MKELTLATLIFFGGAGIVAQAAAHKQVLLSNVSVIDLQKVEDSVLGLSVSYPGPDYSQICGVEIRADNYNANNKIDKFLEAIEIKGRFELAPTVKVQNSSTIDMDFTSFNGVFGIWFTLETKDGSSLQSTIKKTLGENREVIVVTKTCS
ncbi:MAG: hypothetical protein V4654_06725 [Bdellovibrionota bacterium]